jgi:type-F conjugative transfer system pilin assembly protein TrbC
MNNKNALILSTFLVLSGQAFCQESQPTTQDEMRSFMDQAMERAREGNVYESRGQSTKQLDDAYANTMKQAKEGRPERQKDLPLTLPDGDRKIDVLDPNKIAEQMKKAHAKQQPEDDLMIFVSTSLAPETLKLLGEQVQRAGGILMLRGFKGGLKKGALQETMIAMKPVVDSGANFQIDPEAFTRFDVQAVPTFVLAAPVEGCHATLEQKCELQAAKLSGDVSLDYALEHWVKRGGRSGRIAEKYLKKMQRSQN